MMKLPLIYGCLCGAIPYEIARPPIGVYVGRDRTRRHRGWFE
jgi:hypothetical protein